MIRVLPILIGIGLAVYCIVDCAQTPQDEVRNLPKLVWVFVILMFTFAGPIAWLLAGRPRREAQHAAPDPGMGGGPAPGAPPWPAPRSTGRPRHEQRPLGPDDDPDFLNQMKALDSEHELLLKQWESDLRRREQELRREESEESGQGQRRNDDKNQTDPPPMS